MLSAEEDDMMKENAKRFWCVAFVSVMIGALVLSIVRANEPEMSNGTDLTVDVLAYPDVVNSGGHSTVVVTVHCQQTPISGATVAIQVSDGSVNPVTGTTSSNGTLVADFAAPVTTQTVNCTVSATASMQGYNPGTGTARIMVVGSGSGTTLDVVMSASPDTINSGKDSFVSVMVSDGGQSVQGADVQLSASAGGVFTPQNGMTDQNGEFSSDYTAPIVSTLTQCDLVAQVSKSGYSSATATFSVTILPSGGGGNQSFYIVVNPPSASLSVGYSMQFNAQGYDCNNNPLPNLQYQWSVMGGIGTVKPSSGNATTFHASTPGYGHVIAEATWQSITAQGRADVAVVGNGSKPFYIVVNPPSAKLFIGDVQSFTAQAYDQNSNPIQGLQYYWDVTGGIGKVNPLTGDMTTFTATANGYGQVMAKATWQSATVTGWSDVYVGGGGGNQSFYIVVNPQKAALLIGDVQSFAAQGYDRSGNPIPNLQYTWAVTGGIGTVNPGLGDKTSFTATANGYGQVIAESTWQGITATGWADVYVGCGGNKSFYILVNPPKAQLDVGDVQNFTAQGYDQNGTPIQNLQYLWSVSGGIGGVSSSTGGWTTFTAKSTGFGEVIAEASWQGFTATGSASIYVDSSNGTDLSVSPKDIGFSNPKPKAGDTVVIYAMIHSIGKTPGRGEVCIYDGNPKNGGVQIGTMQQVYVIPGFTDVAFVDWVASDGSHEIYVIIDNVQPKDANTVNNAASTVMTVGSGQDPNLEIKYAVTTSQNGDTITIRVDIQVTCHKQAVHNLHIIIWDSSNLAVEFSASNINVAPGDTAMFTISVKIKTDERVDRKLLVQAVGDDGESGVAEIPIQSGALVPSSGWWTPDRIIAVCVGTGLGVGAAVAVFFRWRHRVRSV